MHDFNYFKPYHKVKGKTNWGRLIGFVIVLLALAFVGFNIFTMITRLNSLKGEVASLEVRLNDPHLIAVAEEVEAEEKKLKGLRSDGFSLGALKDVIDYDAVFDYEKLDTIIDRLVDDCYLESINYTGQWLSLQGVVEKESLTNVAQLVYNLRDSEEYAGFNINMVSRVSDDNEDVYNFAIEFLPVEYAAGIGR